MQRTQKLYILLFVLLASGVFFAPARATEKTTSVENVGLSSEDAPPQQPVFEYQLEGRPDPFMPFISRQTALSKNGSDDELINEKKELTGMQLFEPGQLTLVAVLYSGNKRMAMVEDVTGKGYILTEDMPIGRRGTVSRIEGGQVTITEVAHTRSGRIRKNTIVMRLNKEGDR